MPPRTDQEVEQEFEVVRDQLEAGMRASEIANRLQGEGYGNLQIVMIFRMSTGAGLAQLKTFGRWWGPEGVTDEAKFNAWADEVFRVRLNR